MIKSQNDIYKLIDDGIIKEGLKENAGVVSYDLRIKCFYADGGNTDEYQLFPGNSVFVGSVECINLPENLVVTVLLRNRWIRKGLLLDAPMYFPGHSTRVFYRVTNLSGDIINLSQRDGLAQIIFQEVAGSGRVYSGNYEDEFDFRGVGTFRLYEDGLAKNEKIEKNISSTKEQILKSEKKVEESEHRIYINVLALMSIIIAVLSISGIAFKADDIGQLIVQVMLLSGSSALLFGLITTLVKQNPKFEKYHWAIWLIAAICMLIAVVIFLIDEHT